MPIFLNCISIALALLRPQKADAQQNFITPFQDCGTICAGNTFEKRGDSFVMEEIWKIIAGYKGLYEVSNQGRVRSVDRVQPHGQKNLQRILKGRIIRCWINSKGYSVVALSNQGIVKNKTVHKLVCNAFHQNPKKLPCVNHKDGIKLNNVAENLEHVSYSQNNRHAFDTGLRLPTINRGEQIGTCKLKSAQVLAIRKLASNGSSGAEIAKSFQISRSAACRIIKKITWKHL